MPAGWVPSLIRRCVVFSLVSIGWLFFRAQTITQAMKLAGRIFTPWHLTALALSMLGLLLFYVGPLFLFEIWIEHRQNDTALLAASWFPRAIVYSYCVLMLIIFPSPVAHEFIYFQF